MKILILQPQPEAVTNVPLPLGGKNTLGKSADNP